MSQLAFDLSQRRYPEHAGSKEKGGTSEEAADAIESSGRAQVLRDRVFEYFRSGKSATADEVAHALGESILAIRPRVSELRKQFRIVSTGQKRRADGGRPAHVWRAA